MEMNGPEPTQSKDEQISAFLARIPKDRRVTVDYPDGSSKQATVIGQPYFMATDDGEIMKVEVELSVGAAFGSGPTTQVACTRIR